MAKSSPEKLARALRANLRRRKGSLAQEEPEDGRAAAYAPKSRPAPAGREKPVKSPRKS